MNKYERRAATINAFREMDPESMGGIYLADIAERVAQKDSRFIGRYNLVTKALGLVGIKRAAGSLGFTYLPRLYPVTAHLEGKGIIDSEWDDTEVLPDRPRRRIYRYKGLHP